MIIYLIRILSEEYNDDPLFGELVLNTLWIINNLLMGNNISVVLIQDFDLVTIILRIIQSNHNIIVEVSLMIIGKYLYIYDKAIY